MYWLLKNLLAMHVVLAIVAVDYYLLRDYIPHVPDMWPQCAALFGPLVKLTRKIFLLGMLPGVFLAQFVFALVAGAVLCKDSNNNNECLDHVMSTVVNQTHAFLF